TLQVRGRRLPGLAEVAADVDVGPEVVEAMAVEGRVDRALVVARRHDLRHPDALGQTGDPVADVRPRAAAVARGLHDAIVGPGVDDAGALRRLGERDDGRPRLDAVVLG